MKNEPVIGAVILAAGMSTRMGQAKMLLPFKKGTVLSTVLDTLHLSNIHPLITVVGGARIEVENLLNHLPFEVLVAVNPDPANSEMMDSLRIGVGQLPGEVDAFLIVLGDQPQISHDLIIKIVNAYAETGEDLIIPSYRMRRGHPWLIGKKYWKELVEMPSEFTMRDFLRKHQGLIYYLVVDTPEILSDLDTPEDYRRAIQ